MVELEVLPYQLIDEKILVRELGLRLTLQKGKSNRPNSSLL